MTGSIDLDYGPENDDTYCQIAFVTSNGDEYVLVIDMEGSLDEGIRIYLGQDNGETCLDWHPN